MPAKIALLCAVAVGALLVGRWALRPEPYYRGLPVRDWVEQALATARDEASEADDDQRDEANSKIVVAIGAPAVPFLIEELRRYQRGWLSRNMYHLTTHCPAPVRMWTRGLFGEEYDHSADVVAPVRLLERMGEAARPAARDILRCLNTADMHYWGAIELVHSLANMGDVARDAAPGLAELARGNWHSGRVAAARAHYCITGRPEVLLEALRQSIRREHGLSNDSQEFWPLVQDAKLHRSLVPLLADTLVNPELDQSDRGQAAICLSEMGADGLPAVPLLVTTAFITTSPELRYWAWRAIEEIVAPAPPSFDREPSPPSCEEP